MNQTDSPVEPAPVARILIAEDSAIQAEKLRRLLAGNGYTVSVARNGAEGFNAVAAEPPDLVVSDIVMPEMDGFDFCRRVKADGRLAKTPFVLLTSLAEPQDVIRAVECGADQFVTKPYDGLHLLTTIRNLLRDQGRSEREDDRGSIVISHGESRYTITADRRKILNLLLSTYETAMAMNRDLTRAQEALQSLNDELEAKVDQRTAALLRENAERRAAEQALRAKNEELNAVLEQLWQAAKLATMGELASSIAHELNNPLAIVSLRIESLMAQTSAEDPRWRELEIIGNEVERMGELVTNLLQFSRRSQKAITSVSIEEECERTLELIHYHLRKNDIRVIRECGTDVPMVLADRQQMRQLFLNLFTNAADAMPRGGSLTVRIAAPLGEKKVSVEIADTGTGISPEIITRVTEPFFTTKPEGKGTGLGLAICRRIVQEHRGTFDIASSGIPGEGTTVRIEWPSNGGGDPIDPEESGKGAAP